ncbi:MAG TPA: DUF1571 domain-containing protein [Phycisphaerae bacterium]|nr:DUF1571 domain-containing protein [Phycisphaerae bacterium]HRY67846.1 DUF1571 domain-containing protein [Phycisphaerae bacterium]HSA25299.1 DUF1571 domain-containing protein [Phycisphaerae bacterium]
MRSEPSAPNRSPHSGPAGLWHRAATGQVLTAAAIAIMTILGGCGAPGAKIESRVETPQEQYAREGQRIAADPVACLRRLKTRCDAMEQYQLTFYRQERLGVVPQLTDMEIIRARFRKTPFSVKFEWDDERMPFFESVYVAGQNDGKLLIRERHGLLFMPPQVRILDADLPTRIGKAKNPITSFGLAQVTSRSLDAFDDPKTAKVMTIKYEGVVDLDPMHRPAHHLVVQRPPMPGYQYTRQDFYIDAETLLPSGTDLWLKDGTLDARYRYTDVRERTDFTDADFRLDKDHPDGKRNTR